MFVSTAGILARPTPLPTTYSMCTRSDWTWIDVTNPTTGRVWMDRNIGANRVATASNDTQAYGMLYQWGRLSDDHQCIARYAGSGVTTSSTTATLSTSDSPGNSLFITNSSGTFDWRNPQNDNLWQGVSGVNNPCPTGYRLSTEAELTAEIASWSTQNTAGAFASPLKFTPGGYRLHTNGALSFVGIGGNYWSSTVSGVGSKYLSFATFATINTFDRADGMSVRCIKN